MLFSAEISNWLFHHLASSFCTNVFFQTHFARGFIPSPRGIFFLAVYARGYFPISLEIFSGVWGIFTDYRKLAVMYLNTWQLVYIFVNTSVIFLIFRAILKENIDIFSTFYYTKLQIFFVDIKSSIDSAFCVQWNSWHE